MGWGLAIILGIGAYLVGSFPTSYFLVSMAKGVDIRQVGTGNVGALNAYHQVGLAGGLLVLAIDASKGVLAALIPDWTGAPHWTIFLLAPLLVAGHNWSAFLRFRGGKGAAAIFGISLALAPVLTLITLAAVVALVVAIRNVVWAALFGFVLLNGLFVATQQGTGQIALCRSLTAMVTATYLASVREHISNSIKTRQWRRLIVGLA